MRAAILQSCYIPWKGYFDIIGSVDTFVVYDDVQYSKNHWHNRNIIKTPNGPHWLTIPVSKLNGSFHNIDTVRIAKPFAPQHWDTIKQFYSRSAHFKLTSEYLDPLYVRAANMEFLSDINFMFMEAISRMLGFDTKFVWSSALAPVGAKSDRLLSICKTLGATTYLSGPSAQSYLQVDKFAEAGIEVEWMDYSGYPAYSQLHGSFDPKVSIIDLIFNTGDQALKFMKSRPQ